MTTAHLDTLTTTQAITDFLIAKKADGLSAATLRWYSFMLAPVGERFNDLASVTGPDVRQYIIELRERQQRTRGLTTINGGLSDSSITSTIRALHVFFNWCTVEYGLTSSPVKNIRRPKIKIDKPRAITGEDIQRLITAAYDYDNELIAKRNLAILCFLADTGARNGGVTGLTLDRLDLIRGRATLIEKGDRTRIVPLSPVTIAVISEWLTIRPETAQTVFCGLKNGHYGEPLTQSGLIQLIKKIAKRAGVKKFNPHSFRHFFALHWLDKGGDARRLADILGHADPGFTLRVYAGFSIDQLAAKHAEISPLGKLEIPHDPTITGGDQDHH
jgi:site-specific recombinase XerD